jgi:hypothetical protein
MSKSRHECFGQSRVRAKSVDYNLFLVDPNTRLCGGDRIAVIGVGKQRGFSEELATTRGMQDYKVVIECAADQAKATAFDLVDRRSRITLAKQ